MGTHGGQRRILESLELDVLLTSEPALLSPSPYPFEGQSLLHLGLIDLTRITALFAPGIPTASSVLGF